MPRFFSLRARGVSPSSPRVSGGHTAAAFLVQQVQRVGLAIQALLLGALKDLVPSLEGLADRAEERVNAAS